MRITGGAATAEQEKQMPALNVLDAIARQHSECSGFAQRMAAQWRRESLRRGGKKRAAREVTARP